MKRHEIIFWDVDTQYDFMKPDGKLYVPDSEDLIDVISRIRRFALSNGYSIIASMDWHSMENQEISLKPDFKNTFPPHCMAGQKGAERVGFIGDFPVSYIDLQKIDEREMLKLLDRVQFHLVLKSDTIDVFDNPNTIELLNLLKPESVAVFGVALDFCVYETVNGLLQWGQTRIILVVDGVKAINTEKEKQILDEFEKKGVILKTLDQLEKELI